MPETVKQIALDENVNRIEDAYYSPTSELKPYKNNSRKHPHFQIEALAAAIERFGFTQPIIIDESNNILAGHGRHAAALKLGLKEVPVRKVEHLTDDEKKAYVISDNKIAEQSTWDTEVLLEELSSLRDFDADKAILDILDIDTFTPYKNEQVKIASVKPHPKNYKEHPSDQIEHLKKSISDNGIYRNIIVSSDNFILAGHGVVKAATELGLTSVPILRLNINSKSVDALKFLAADNEVSHLGHSDDRALTEILKQVLQESDLLGTGYDEDMLANLLYVTRPASEIQSTDHAKEWVGMPEYESTEEDKKIIVIFSQNPDEEMEKFCNANGFPFQPEKSRQSFHFPYTGRHDWTGVRFEANQ